MAMDYKHQQGFDLGFGKIQWSISDIEELLNLFQRISSAMDAFIVFF